VSDGTASERVFSLAGRTMDRQEMSAESRYYEQAALKHLNYIDRLKACKLTTLHYRQIRGDMID